MLNIKNNIGSLPEGAYVWKKYEPNPDYIKLSFTQLNSGSTPTQIQVTSDTVDVSTLSADFFNGKTVNRSDGAFSLQFTSATSVKYSSSNLTYSFDPSTGIITIQTEFNMIISWADYDNGADPYIFLDFVVSDSPTAYPNGAVHTDGYWYEMYGVPISIVTWANGTDEEIVAMVEAADKGLIDLSDYWAVGDVRTVQLSAMSATGVGESHVAQQVDLVLMHTGGYDLDAAVASGRTKCSFVVGLKDSLAEAGYMNSSNTNSGSWDGSARRTWCNNVFRNAIPSTLKAIFKQFKTVTGQTYGGSTNQTSVDYFALPAEREIFGARTYCNQTEYNALFQFDYYKTASNIVKKLGKTGTADSWWERSPVYNDSRYFCRVYDDGTVGTYYADNSFGLAPFGCI